MDEKIHHPWPVRVARNTHLALKEIIHERWQSTGREPSFAEIIEEWRVVAERSVLKAEQERRCPYCESTSYAGCEHLSFWNVGKAVLKSEQAKGVENNVTCISPPDVLNSEVAEWLNLAQRALQLEDMEFRPMLNMIRQQLQFMAELADTKNADTIDRSHEQFGSSEATDGAPNAGGLPGGT